MAPEPEEDIAAIAKQISDHAEAIYQTWKARGLAPDEILTCHRDSSAADKFGSVLTPQPKTTVTDAVTASPHHHKILSDSNTNNLERLVNKFVVEDKARLAARQRSVSPKPFASSIQYALQKFEQKASCNSPDQQLQQVQPKPMGGKYGKLSTKTNSYPDDSSAVSNKKNVAATTNSNDAGSWSFRKNNSDVNNRPYTAQQQNSNFMDEVAKEEQRLIDALKNGSVIENNVQQCRKSEKPAVPSKEGVLMQQQRSAGYEMGAGNRPSSIIAVTKPEFLIGLSALSSSRRNQHAHRQLQEQVPHPELTDHQRANIQRSNHHQQSNPVRPFLTRGSVAERVLIFEKCPTELMKTTGTAVNNTAPQSPWRNIGSDVHGKIQVSTVIFNYYTLSWVRLYYYITLYIRYYYNMQ